MSAFRPDPPRAFGTQGTATDGIDGQPNVVAPVARLIAAFRRLPSIGPKSAQRLAYHLINSAEQDAEELADAVVGIKREVALCQACADITTVARPVCGNCTDDRRDRTVVCVVEEPLDVVAIERTRSYSGSYHVLHGAISPTNGIGPSDLKFAELMARLQADDSPIAEVIVATNPNLDGEATAMHLQRSIEPLGIKVTRIARGLPSGADIEFADDATLAHALQSRSAL